MNLGKKKKKNIQKKRITKVKHDNLGDNKKEQLRKEEKKENKVLCDNLDDEEKEHFKKEDNRRKIEKHDKLERTVGKIQEK